ncbi:MAG: hypothetical protein ACYCX5_12030 [Coriobacteriia bacterium]
MTDEQPTPVPEVPVSGESAGDAWRDVVAQLDEFGAALGRWMKAAVNDPDNKARAAEVKSKMESIASSLGEAADKAVDSEVGQSFKDAAEKTGDAFKKAGEKISEEVGPSLAGAFRSAADKFREAAAKMEEKTAGGTPDGDAPGTGAAPEDGVPRAE